MPKRKPSRAADKLRPIVGRRIVESGGDPYNEHRAGITTCPHCDHEMHYDEWKKCSHTLVMNPGCYKSGHVALVAECPACFKNSWVHRDMTRFTRFDALPEEWNNRVHAKSAADKLNALRDWGRGLCWRCSRLESAEIGHHAYRYCTVGMGAPATECEMFAEIEPNKSSSLERAAAGRE